MQKSLQQLAMRMEELDRSLMDPSVASDGKKLREITKERATLEPIVQLWTQLEDSKEELEEAKELALDREMAEMAQEEIQRLNTEIPALEQELRLALIPPDPFEGADIILEVRAGTGGDEAALFAYDLFRMYSRFCEKNRWKVEILSSSYISVGGTGKTQVGYKEVICQVSGGKAYRHLRHESGVHRVQRVPLTETQGRVHTSAATVAIMPVPEEVEVDINTKDLRIDSFRASGSGGQHVNTTDSAIRITHIPTGVVVQCQDEKSQHKNKAKALKVLSARLLEAQRAAAHASSAEQRRQQVGSGDRSERIRTYNFPQNRITDHRINLTLYKLDRILEGDVSELVDGLNAYMQEKLIEEHAF